jgi:hypothetical protein
MPKSPITPIINPKPIYIHSHRRENMIDLNKQTNKQKQTLWLLVHKRTIPTERPPNFGEI